MKPVWQAARGHAKTGVTMVEVINGDGKLDIYVCYSGKLRPERRVNQLFINQGNEHSTGVPHFKDMAADYELNFFIIKHTGLFF